jgi:hypothetical protein
MQTCEEALAYTSPNVPDACVPRVRRAKRSRIRLGEKKFELSFVKYHARVSLRILALFYAFN